jgi:hypothetical protein
MWARVSRRLQIEESAYRFQMTVLDALIHLFLPEQGERGGLQVYGMENVTNTNYEQVHMVCISMIKDLSTENRCLCVAHQAFEQALLFEGNAFSPDQSRNSQ